MNLLTLWIAVAAVTAIVVVTAQTLWDYHQRRKFRKSMMDGWIRWDNDTGERAVWQKGGIQKMSGSWPRGNQSEYYSWDWRKASMDIEPIGSIDELRIPGLSEDEADEFWHAVNDK